MKPKFIQADAARRHGLVQASDATEGHLPTQPMPYVLGDFNARG